MEGNIVYIFFNKRKTIMRGCVRNTKKAGNLTADRGPSTK